MKDWNYQSSFFMHTLLWGQIILPLTLAFIDTCNCLQVGEKQHKRIEDLDNFNHCIQAQEAISHQYPKYMIVITYVRRTPRRYLLQQLNNQYILVLIQQLLMNLLLYCIFPPPPFPILFLSLLNIFFWTFSLLVWSYHRVAPLQPCLYNYVLPQCCFINLFGNIAPSLFHVQ